MFQRVQRIAMGIFLLWLPACEKPLPAPPSGPLVSSQVAGTRTVTNVEIADPEQVPQQPVELAFDDDARAVAELKHAESLLVTFIQKAGDDPAYSEAVQRARQRLQDVRDTIAWLEQGLAIKKGKHAPAPLGSNAS